MTTTTIQIPVRICIGDLVNGPTEAAPADAMERSGPKQPIIDTNYSSRTGFNVNFIGIPTPMPTLTDTSLAAPRLDGQGHVLPYEHFSIVMHAARRLALFTASNVNYDPDAKKPEPGRNYSRKGLNGFGPNDRGEIWRLDSRIAAHHQVEYIFYAKDDGAFQQGHVVRREDVCFGGSYAQVRRANGDTFHSTNCTPQRPDFNDSNIQGIWGRLENFIQGQADTEKLNLFSGPVLSEHDRIFDGEGNNGPLSVRIPTKFWKVVCANDHGTLKVFGFLLEQSLQGISTHEFYVSDDWVSQQVSLQTLEVLVPQLKFDETLHDADTAASDDEGVSSGSAGRAPSPRRLGSPPAATPGKKTGKLRSVGPASGKSKREATSVSATPRIHIPGVPPSKREATAAAHPRLVVGKVPLRKAETVIGADDRVRIETTNQAPWRMICSLTMESPNGQFIGTGWLVGKKTIVTAGHCVYDNNPTGMGGWATKITVAPGRNASTYPFGKFVSSQFFSNSTWVDSQDPDYDFGCIQLDEAIAEQVGSFDVLSASEEELTNYLVNIAGYPGDRGNGAHLYHHRNQIVRVSDRRLFYSVDTYGGQSGAPVFVYETAGGPPMVVGIHAYGTGGDENLVANSAPRILPDVAELIQGWIADNP